MHFIVMAIMFWALVFQLFFGDITREWVAEQTQQQASYDNYRTMPGEDDLAYHQRRSQAIDGPDWTDLHRAVVRNDAAEVQRLIKQGANLEARTRWQATPLHEAARRGNVAMIKLLLDNGADIDAECNIACTPLHTAAEYKQAEAIRYLLKRGANPNKQTVRGSTPLVKAAFESWHGDDSVVRAFVEHGVSKSQLNGALGIAAQENFESAVLYLLSNGAHPDSKNGRGYPALYWAIKYENKRVIDAILKHGGNPDLSLPKGQTTMQFAQKKGNAEILATLMRAKQSGSQKSSRG